MSTSVQRWLAKVIAFFEIDLGDDELNRKAFTLNMAVLFVFGATLLQMGAVMLFSEYRPSAYGLPALRAMPLPMRVLALSIMVVLIADFVAYALTTSGRVRTAAWLLVGVLTLYTVVESVISGGAGGWSIFALLPTLLAILTLDWQVSVLLVLLFTVLDSVLLSHTAMAVGPWSGGAMVPVRLAGIAIVNILIAFYFLFLMVWVTLFLLRRSLRQAEEAQQTADVLRVALERRLNEQEAVQRLLESTVQRYADFLVEAASGEERELLPVEEIVNIGAQEEGVVYAILRALRKLGTVINETVQRLWLLLQESERMRGEAERARKRYLQRAWREYLAEKRQLYSAEEGEPTDESLLREALRTALAQQGPALRKEEATDAMAVPITMGEAIIGLLALEQTEASPTERWTEEERRFVALIADRLSVTLNTLRLLDETQRREARERFIGRFTARIRAAATVEEALADAMAALRETFATEEVVARLQVEAAPEEVA